MSEAMSALGEPNLMEPGAPHLRLVEDSPEFKISQVEHALLRGPYVGRLMAQRTLLEAAETKAPYRVYEEILEVEFARQRELDEFDAAYPESVVEFVVKKAPKMTFEDLDNEHEEPVDMEDATVSVPHRRAEVFNVPYSKKAISAPEKPIVWPPVRNAAKQFAAGKQPQRFSPVTGLPMPPEDMPLPQTELEQRQHVEEQRAAETLRAQWSLGLSGPSQRNYSSSIGPAAFSKENGLCEQTDPEAFFPEKGGSTREAKKVCLECEVRDDCLEYALDNDERFGIWGGLSERERRKLKKRLV
jgi:WhiB family redox-sensing transcriptional regulator